MTTLVVGASGNVGSQLVQILAVQGEPVRAAMRATSNARLPKGATAVRLDFADPASFGPALAGVDRLFLLRPPAISDTKRYLNPFIDAARRAGVERVAFLSLQGAERNPVVPHHQVERYLMKLNMEWTFLRAGFFMQNLSTTHRDEIRDQGEIIVPAGRGRTSFIDVRDIAAVAALALCGEGHSRQAYTLTGAEALGYSEVAALLSAALGRPIAYRRPSLARFVRSWRARGAAPAYILVMLGIYLTARFGMAAGIAPDVGRLLGRAPIAMGQFIADHRAAWL
jgi:uncharacterized protein YbjT (DUF2867 family)